MKSAHILGSTGGLDFKFGSKVHHKKTNRSPQFWIGHVTGVFFTDQNMCILQTSLQIYTSHLTARKATPIIFFLIIKLWFKFGVNSTGRPLDMGNIYWPAYKIRTRQVAFVNRHLNLPKPKILNGNHKPLVNKMANLNQFFLEKILRDFTFFSITSDCLLGFDLLIISLSVKVIQNIHNSIAVTLLKET